MRTAARDAPPSGKRLRAASIILRRGIWRATRPLARLHAALPRRHDSGDAAGARVETPRTPAEPERRWLLATVLGIIGIAVLALLHLPELIKNDRPSVAEAQLSQSSVTVSLGDSESLPPATPSPDPQFAPTLLDENAALVEIEPPRSEAPLYEPPLIGSRQNEPPLNEPPPPEPRPNESPSFAFDPQPLPEPPELSCELSFAVPSPAPRSETVSDAWNRFFVTSAQFAQFATPSANPEESPIPPGDEDWRPAIPLAERVNSARDVRTVSFVQSSANAAATTRVGPLPLLLEAAPPASADSGTPVEIVLRVTNSGESAIEGARVLVDLPEGLSHPRGRELEQTLDALAPGETRDVRLIVTPERAGEFVFEARIATEIADGPPVTVPLKCSESPPVVLPDGALPQGVLPQEALPLRPARGMIAAPECDCLP